MNHASRGLAPRLAVQEVAVFCKTRIAVATIFVKATFLPAKRGRLPLRRNFFIVSQENRYEDNILRIKSPNVARRGGGGRRAGALTVAADAMSHHTASGTPWYAESAPPSNALPSQSDSGQRAVTEATNRAKEMSLAFHQAADKVLPSVVMITNTPARWKDPPPESRLPMRIRKKCPLVSRARLLAICSRIRNSATFSSNSPRFPRPTCLHGTVGAGSGVIVDPSGVILTNNHVVAGGGRVTVRLQDGREFKAVDIKTDPKTDLAVLRIEGAGTLPAARLGDSSKVEVGEWVLALGQPFGLEGTVTAGIVSAKERGLGITAREDFIQTDAAINPGNSGGPLVDLDGEVIGINTAISSSNGGYQGVGFAIPANLAKWVGGQLETSGMVHRSYLGVIIQPVTQSLAQQFKVKVHQGVLITEVRPDTPAAKAGLKPGDIILKFAGQAVSTPRELQGIVEQAKIGSTDPLTLLRDGKEMTLQVTCRELPSDVAETESGSHEHEHGSNSSHFDKLGLQVEDLSPQVAEQLGIKAEHGVAITEVRSGSPAALAGLSTGMVITEVNRHSIKTVEDFRKALEAKPLDQGILLLVRSAEGSRFVVIRAES